MLEAPGAVAAALSLHGEFPNISIGLHVDPFGSIDSDYSTTALAYWCRWQPNKIFRDHVIGSTEHQIKHFQDTFGFHPPHVSVQSDMHTNHSGKPFDWFVDLISRLSEGNNMAMTVRGVHTMPVRHTRFRELLLRKNPLTPEQFQLLLQNISTLDNRPVELVVHPAIYGESSEEPLRAFYTTKLRERDLEDLIKIINSGVIENAGYILSSPEALQKID